MPDLTTIRSHLTTSEAYVLKGLLEAHKIACFLKNESIINTDHLFFDPHDLIQLQVDERDAERAAKLIAETE